MKASLPFFISSISSSLANSFSFSFFLHFFFFYNRFIHGKYTTDMSWVNETHLKTSDYLIYTLFSHCIMTFLFLLTIMNFSHLHSSTVESGKRKQMKCNIKSVFALFSCKCFGERRRSEGEEGKQTSYL